jgi:hypothetical protein
MKLRDLCEDKEFDSEKEKSGLINKIRDIKKDIAELQRKSASHVQSGIAPQYKQQWDRLKTAKSSTESDLKKLEDREKAHKDSHEFNSNYAGKQAAETAEEKKERFGKAVSAGLNSNNKARAEEGGQAGIAEKMYKYVKSATNDGVEKITAEEIAHHFDTTARTINRWLETKEFNKVARLMGRR